MMRLSAYNRGEVVSRDVDQVMQCYSAVDVVEVNYVGKLIDVRKKSRYRAVYL
ncbi:MAG: hypothetical protein N3G21_03790 [Candidatus Hydrogenedentes bacterium]|nr:hypothetical protein [Candidatus Hydrogenedentota bacterium]